MLHHIALTLLRGISQAQTLALLRHGLIPQQLFDDPQTALAAVQPALQQRLLAALREHAPQALARAAEEVAFCEKHHISILPYGSEDYPTRLTHCADAPALLYYKGKAALNTQRVLAIVGTRRISTYGKDLCRQFCTDLAEALPDTLVVSGLAYGVDIHAHRACLASGLPTVGVVAHGLNQIYPASHRDTAKTMLQRGGLLTEYVSQTAPIAAHFVRRNRIVAGMADATLVVESASKGGALITAQLALDYDRAVFAYPGRSTDEASAGCNQLIRQQTAQLVTSAAELIADLNWAPQPSPQPQQLELFPTLPPHQQAIADALRKEESLQAQQLALRCNLPLADIQAALFEMEMTGLVGLLAGGRYRLLR